VKVSRRFTVKGKSPYEGIPFSKRNSEIRNTNGSLVFEARDIDVPAHWSQVAVDILAQKYFRKAGVPQVGEDGKALLDEAGKPVLGGERDARQVFHRLAGCWRDWGEKYGYFDSTDDAQTFEDELSHMLANQMAAPNSPQWFNTGLHFKYGITGPAQGHYYVDDPSGRRDGQKGDGQKNAGQKNGGQKGAPQKGPQLTKSKSAYERPQPHACFIQSVEDDLVGDGGIMDLWTREARLFKYGSGTGSNFSRLRGENEPLSGGGKSSGLMSFLRIGDRAAGAIKSGGTTRRAAKMVCLDLDHPDIETFVSWKVNEEQKVAALVTGSKQIKHHLNAVINSCHVTDDDGNETTILKPRDNAALQKALQDARTSLIPENYLQRCLQLASQGLKAVDITEYNTDWDGEAYGTVSGQNSNNSVRVPNEFFRAVDENGKWRLIRRTDRGVAKEIDANELWDKVAYSAWACADPGVQYDTTINEWHTCPNDGRINASNPCSEYMFLDDTACNLASINLAQFLHEDGSFDLEGYKHAIRLWTIVLEVSVLMASFPSQTIARLSYEFRTLGLGYANLGTILMRLGIPYASEKAYAIAGALSAVLTGEAYATSAEMAKELGAFPRYGNNEEEMLRVIRNHRRAAYHAGKSEYEGLSIAPAGIDPQLCPSELLEAARECWDRAMSLGEKHGYRNAQVSCIAPTGTIGLLMDCDTTGVEPDFALVKFKKLAGGGYFKIANQSLAPALKKLGYEPKQIDEIVTYVVGRKTLAGAPHVNHESLASKGFDDAALQKVEKALESAFDVSFAFNKGILGEEFLKAKLGLSDEQLDDWSFNLLEHLGFSKKQIAAATDYVCGTMTVEGAPHLKDQHLPVFDCEPLRQEGQALHPVRSAPLHDGGRAAVHLGRDQQDDQHAARRGDRRRQARLPPRQRADAQGRGALPRRQQAEPAAQLHHRRRGRVRRVVDVDRVAGGAEARRAHHRARRAPLHRQAPPPAGPPRRLHAEGQRRRPQDLPAHRRVRGRVARRDLPRHAQGRRGVPQPDELLRDRRVARPAARRAAGRVRRRVRVHALRAERRRAGPRPDQDGHVGHRLRVPRARDQLPRPRRAGPGRPRGPQQHDDGRQDVRPGVHRRGGRLRDGLRRRGRADAGARGHPPAPAEPRHGARPRAARSGRRERRAAADADQGGAREPPDAAADRRGPPEGLRRRPVRRLRRVHAGSQRHVPEVRELRRDQRLQLARR